MSEFQSDQVESYESYESYEPYEPSRQMMAFYVAGFQFWDGALALAELKVGERVDLIPELKNPHDPNAVAIRFRGKKLGYVPRESNAVLAQMLYFGHRGCFEAVVQQVSPERSPWHQVRVGVFVTDAR